MKLCECGCGAPTAPAKQTQHGYQKGQLQRFCAGHRPNPKQHYKKYGTNVLAHRQRAERALGHALPADAIVHHADGSRRMDAPLVILENQREHMQLHARMRVRQAGGNPWTEKFCSRCHVLRKQTEFARCRRNYDGLLCYCRACDHDLKQIRASRSGAAA